MSNQLCSCVALPVHIDRNALFIREAARILVVAILMRLHEINIFFRFSFCWRVGWGGEWRGEWRRGGGAEQQKTRTVWSEGKDPCWGMSLNFGSDSMHSCPYAAQLMHVACMTVEPRTSVLLVCLGFGLTWPSSPEMANSAYMRITSCGKETFNSFTLFSRCK